MLYKVETKYNDGQIELKLFDTEVQARAFYASEISQADDHSDELEIIFLAESRKEYDAILSSWAPIPEQDRY